MFWMERSKGTYVEIIIFQKTFSFLNVNHKYANIYYLQYNVLLRYIISTLQYYSFIFVKYSDSCMHTTQTTLPGQHIAHITWNISP